MLTLESSAPVSRFAFGTMQFGSGADEGESRAMLDACREAGITHFDTAVGYSDGRSEQILGRLAAPIRDSLYIATKVAFHGDASAVEIRAQFEDCRRQLNMDSVDLLYIHRHHPETPLDETIDTLAQMQSEGLIRHIGLSNFAAWQVMKAQAIAQSMGTRIDAIQPMYNLVKRQAEVELLPMAADQDIAVLPYSPLGGGLLTGKYAGNAAQEAARGRLDENSMYARRYAPGWMHEAATGLADLARQEGTDPATLAVAWVASHPAGPMPIISARNTRQLAPSLAALDYEMSAELRARISALVPSPPPATDRLEEAG
ncbi:aldo/keto reductase [Pseudoroseicyclus aestuarii]|uniref:Aryl-alcohol dehydrogenase-like predicted oxidoreductase n=1 Tax=Pseudoroseicyclus aestuarii TaxID=1795041 RepID=A0A318T5B8_9RHOB|nr:aldo/keto reductase [Pseudoroseicyclus aestuarii]PYE85574.1 aryl-alcohol dehydrogenase-like predicted oxidoreductase [Pseudoroseicyclus aestuarii]